MVSTPKLYLDNIVKPMVRRLETETAAYDLAFSCCVLVYHFCDVLAKATGEKVGAVRNRIVAADKNFEIVHAVVVAAKHVTVSDRVFGNYVGLRSDDAEIGSAAAFSDGSFFDDGSSFSDMPDVVRIKTPDGAWHDLLYVAKSCERTLEDFVSI